MLLQPNTTFDNHYTLIRQLGRGGFSEVWLAHDSYMDIDVAIKIYAPGQGMDPNSIDEFRREITGVFQLNHPNLLCPKHLGIWENMPYLIMAYCPAGSCLKFVGNISESEIWHLIHDVAAGLAYLHEKDIVHQDIKPDNILVDTEGNYLITDFGISTRARSTLRKSVIGGSTSGGTTAYMGPERFSRQPAPTKASDIWSFGAMAFELLEGVTPFGEIGGGMQKGGAEIPFINAPVSDALKFTIFKMLSKETWDRPTAEELYTYVDAKIKNRPIAMPWRERSETHSSTTTEHAIPFIDRYRPIKKDKKQAFENQLLKYNGYDYVDLGLSVKWATCNVGASKPEEYGDYFAWGETKPKSTYDWSTYKWCEGSRFNQTKYCIWPSKLPDNHHDIEFYHMLVGSSGIDNKKLLDLSDDAAQTNWGDNWRIPSDAEITELRENCTWIWTIHNGVKGCIVISKKNGNSIFLPAAGFRCKSKVYQAGNFGSYWSSSLDIDYPRSVYIMGFDPSDGPSLCRWHERDFGLSIRPIYPN